MWFYQKYKLLWPTVRFNILQTKWFNKNTQFYSTHVSILMIGDVKIRTKHYKAKRFYEFRIDMHWDVNYSFGQHNVEGISYVSQQRRAKDRRLKIFYHLMFCQLYITKSYLPLKAKKEFNRVFTRLQFAGSIVVINAQWLLAFVVWIVHKFRNDLETDQFC